MKCEWNTQDRKPCKKKAVYKVVYRNTGNYYGVCCGTHKPRTRVLKSTLLR